MKIEDYKKTYEEFSGLLSTVYRNLAILGFGVIWILIGGIEGFNKEQIPLLLKLSLGVFVVSIIFDLLHYIYQTLVWYKHFKDLEKIHGTKCDLEFDAEDNKPKYAWRIYWTKIITMLIGYILIFIYILKLIF